MSHAPERLPLTGADAFLLAFDAEKGEFSLWYFQHRFPVNPREYPRILSLAAEACEARSDSADDDLLDGVVGQDFGG